ncbi:MAG: alpha/beta hydrolase [Ignavibacteriales bacterium]|nr:alpha/beta hydrolase [Ignavibacteriales bacterium]
MRHITSTRNIFHEYGNGDKTILFIHGFIFDSTLWQRQIPALAEDYKIIVPDLRGFGGSTDCDGMITMESYVDDLFEILKEQMIVKPVLAGLSMGGYAALRMAERSPEKFSGLVLFDTRAAADSDEAKLKRAAGVRILKHGGLNTYAATLMEAVFSAGFKEREPDEFQSFIDRASGINPKGAIGALLAMMGRTSTISFLESATLPVLALCGEFDTLTPPTEMLQMMSNVKNGEFHIVPDAGHAAPYENFSECNKVLTNFLRNLPF